MAIHKVLYRFILLIATQTLILSCINSNEACLPGNDEYPDDETSLFSVRINTGSFSQTKATDPGTENERIVTGVRIVFYNMDGTIAYVWDLNARNMDNNQLSVFHGSDVSHNNISTKDEFVSVARNIKRADYKMLVILNPIEKIKKITEAGNSIDQLEEPVEIAYSELFESVGQVGYEAKKFTMLNHQGLVFINKDSHFWGTKKEAEANPVGVIVERVVAKIKVTADNIILPDGAMHNGINWNIDVMNRKTYWMRQPAIKADGITLEKPGDSDYENCYAEDPNFNESDQIDPNNEFIYSNEHRDMFYEIGKEAFTLENTMCANNQIGNMTTSVLIRIQYILNGFNWTNAHFFKYKGNLIPYTLFSTYAQNPSLIPDEMGELKDIISQIENETGYNLSQPNRISNSFSLYGLDFHKDGICFYHIPIRHFTNLQVPQPMGYGRYGVVRNNFYTINITGINGPGRLYWKDHPQNQMIKKY